MNAYSGTKRLASGREARFSCGVFQSYTIDNDEATLPRLCPECGSPFHRKAECA